MTQNNNSRHYGNSTPATQHNAPATFSNFITGEGVRRKVNEMIGGEGGQRFITSIISAVSTNQMLATCDHGTILSAAMLGESLKLSPSPQLGQYYMVPYKDKKRCPHPDLKNNTYCKKCNNCQTAQFQLGYKGYIQLAIRSGQYKKLNVMALKEGELIRFDPLNEDIEVDLIQDDLVREQALTIGYYAMFEYTNGFRKAMYWSREKMESHADKYSMAFRLQSYRALQAGQIPQKDMWKYSSFWYKDFDGMAYKTMLRQIISKWGIMSIDMQQVMEKDMAVINDDSTFDYVDSPSFNANPEEQIEAATEMSKEAQLEEESQLLYELAEKMGVSSEEDLALLEQFVEETASGNGSDNLSVYQQALDDANHEAIVAAFTQYYENHHKVHQVGTQSEQPQLTSVTQGLTVAQRRAALKTDIEAFGLDQKSIEQQAGASISGANSTQLATIVNILQNQLAQPDTQTQASPN